jgi:hypothetical protein
LACEEFNGISTKLFLLFWELIDIFQEVQKIRSALLGKDNCRINDVPHMVGFTHTGSIGKIIYRIYFIYTNTSFFRMLELSS